MKRDLLQHRLLAATAAVAALLVVAGPPAAAGVQPDSARARVAVYGGGVDFQPTVAYQSATLTVSGNGLVFQQVFAAGESPSIGMFDPDGQPLADGVYSWRLELVPNAATAESLRRAALAAEGRPDEAWEAQSGSFAIRGGVIAAPELMEAQERLTRPENGSAASLSASSFAGGREAAADDDAAVGWRTGVEAQVAATAAASAAPAASFGALQPANPRAGDDGDATAAALGRSLEPAAALDDTQLSAPSRWAAAPRPRSDGSNGRPRSQ